jgi:hypothetical protein
VEDNLETVGITIEDVRQFALTLPRTHEGTVRGRTKFYVGRIVFVAFDREPGIMGFGFPREWRAAAVEAEPDKFLMPTGVDLKYQWLLVRMDAIDVPEMRDLVEEAWSIAAPKTVVRDYVEAARRAST